MEEGMTDLARNSLMKDQLEMANSKNEPNGICDNSLHGDEVDLVPDGGVKKKILVPGTGDKPVAGNQVHVHYIGRLLNGTKFDSSYDRNNSFSFILGNKEVIAGWDIGVAEMRVGEKSLLTIKPEYGYGDSGAFSTIPPNSTLEFEVELLSTNPKRKSKFMMNPQEIIQAACDEKLRGNQFLQDKDDTSEAILCYKEALAYFEDTDCWSCDEKTSADSIKLGLHLNITLCYLKTEQYVEAISHASDAIKLSPNNSKAYYRRGLAYMNYGLYDKAKKDLIEASAIEDNRNHDISKALHKCDKLIKKQNAKDKTKYQKIFKTIDLYDDKSCLVKDHDVSKLPHVFMDIKIGHNKPIHLVMVLFSDTVPKTAENFRVLCTGQKCLDESTKHLTYKNSIFHRVIRGFMMQGGDFTRGDGTGGESIYGTKFNDEGFFDNHDSRGLLSMANAGPNTNGSQFFITFGSCNHLDGKHVIFGKVVEGLEFLDDVEKVKTDATDKPLEEIRIIDCGEVL